MTVVAPMQPAGSSSIWHRFNPTVCGVLFVFAYLYCVDVAYVILPWLSFSVPGVLNLLVLSATTGSALGCYFTCMFRDPGRVPVGWAPDSEQQGAVQEVKKKDGAPRFCKKCSHYKPPRSHHCRVCDRCVLRMDHHCPWVNNCIGHRNYRSFFGLLIYATLALFHSTGLLIGHALHVVQRSSTTGVIRVGPRATPYSLEGPDSGHFLAHIFMQTFAAAIALPTTVAVAMLLVWHVRMITHNKTTIEYAEGVTAQIKLGAAGSKDRLKHPYDLGPCQNWHEVLGQDPLTWLLPTCASVPGGLSYPTGFDRQQQQQQDFFSF